MSTQDIKPLSGFPEFLPEEQIVFNRMMDIIRYNYELHGFTPLETSAVERKETLLAKGGDEKEIYALSRLSAGEGENTETEMALHFDVTVPFARYVAQHQNDLIFPFRRYQMQKVWRGERPQAGRYREFYQCDIDIIGREALSLHADAEMPAVIYKTFQDMGLGGFMISLNNRKFLEGYLSSLGVAQDAVEETIRIIDKRDKIGNDSVVEQLTGHGMDEEKARAAIAFLVPQEAPDAVLEALIAENKDELMTEGAKELLEVVQSIRVLGVPDTHFRVDFGIARGLGYYTGTIYETVLTEYPEIGSVCSGGRYENLTGQFTSGAFPGVGISIGLSRMMHVLFERGHFTAREKTVSDILVTTMDDAYFADYLVIAYKLRAQGVKTEVYTEKGKFEKQMKYADKKKIPYALIMGEKEHTRNTIILKDLVRGEEREISKDTFVEEISDMLLEAKVTH